MQTITTLTAAGDSDPGLKREVNEIGSTSTSPAASSSSSTASAARRPAAKPPTWR
jgi:hypothetical protein